MSRASLVRLSLCAVVVLTVGVGLISFPQPVVAADDTVTTELQPALNLAGWTEPAASIEAIFDAIPELDLVYAWDAEDQWFRWAVRTDTGVFGDLETLTPGMGLWLSITGEEPVTWTRPIVREGSVARLLPGWNLVAWGGEDGIASRDVLRDIDEILITALDVNGRWPLKLTRGQVIWLDVSGAREWDQTYRPPQIEFVTPVTSQREAEVGALVDDTVKYFFEHAGVRVSGLTVRWGDPGRQLGCSGQYHGVLREIVVGDCLTVFPHEYVHAVQDYLDGNSVSSPLWLTEGVADFWAALYHDYTGDTGYVHALTYLVIPGARRQGFVSFAGHDYKSYHIRALFLARIAGLESILDFYESLSSARTWEESFESTFGLTISEFNLQFAEYTTNLPLPSQGCPLGHIIPREIRQDEGPEVCTKVEGKVTHLSGRPRADVPVVLTADLRDIWGVTPASTRTDSDGSFSLSVPEGTYWLVAQTAGYTSIHYSEEKGLTHWSILASPFVAQGSNLADVEIAWGTLRIFIQGLEQHPDIPVVLWFGRHSQGQYAAPEIEYYLPGGTYEVRVSCPNLGGGGWYNEDAGLVDDRRRGTPIVMDDADVEITISLPADLGCN